MKRTISDLLLKQVKRSAKKTAIGWVNEEEITKIDFQTYKTKIETLSLALLGFGLTPQNKVCIVGETRKEWHLADMAILCSRGVSVPIYPGYTAKEILYILNHSEADFLFLENNHQLKKFLSIQNKVETVKKIISFEVLNLELKNKLKKDIEIFDFDQFLQMGASELTTNPDKFQATTKKIQEEDIATIVYTSGTTGTPKGAVITQKAITQVLLNLEKFSRKTFDYNDSFLTCLPLAHVLGRCESFFPITFGCSCIYASSLDNLINEIQLVKPTMLIGVPRLFEKITEGIISYNKVSPIKDNIISWATNVADKYFEIMDNDQTPPLKIIIEYQLAKKLVFDKIYQAFGGRIRFFISGGAPLNTDVIKFLRSANLTILEGYGLTETVAPCAVNPLNKQIAGTVGQPIGDVEIKIADDGEILIKSEALFKEYYKDPKGTKEVLNEDGWFLSGDIGRINSQGFLKITGRKKNLIITSGGKNISPLKIEGMISRSKYISSAIVLGDKRKYLVALIGLNMVSIKEKFSEMNIQDGASMDELSSNPLINSLIQSEIDFINEELASFETIKKFELLPITIAEHNYLTPSLKVKRKLIEKDFKDQIDAMYN